MNVHKKTAYYRYLGILTVCLYADEGITGTSADKRTEFQRLIRDCKRGKIDRIYTKSLSRFARNTKECLNTVRLLRELGITLFFEKENIDTAKNTDELMITIMGGLAQEESTSISQNMRWSVWCQAVQVSAVQLTATLRSRKQSAAQEQQSCIVRGVTLNTLNCECILIPMQCAG